jgi:transcriptional regulator with XRE-family HTH domain
MYDVIFESLRILKSDTIRKIVSKTGFKSEYIIGVENGKEPSHTFLLEMASFYGISLKDLNSINDTDNNNILEGMDRLERCKKIREILLLHYKNDLETKNQTVPKSK